MNENNKKLTKTLKTMYAIPKTGNIPAIRTTYNIARTHREVSKTTAELILLLTSLRQCTIPILTKCNCCVIRENLKIKIYSWSE